MISLILLKLFTFSQILQGVPKLSHATVNKGDSLTHTLSLTHSLSHTHTQTLTHTHTHTHRVCVRERGRRSQHTQT